MKALNLFLLLVLLTSCAEKIHDRLISFSSEMITDEMFFEPESKFYCPSMDEEGFCPETDSIIYKQDTIYISYIANVNNCGEYKGNVDIRNDSIFLEGNDVSDYACASFRLDRFIFEIHNPDNKEYTIVKY